jgi:predicted peroxiredoxin
MSGYLFIESRDPYESAEVSAYYDLAVGLVKEGAKVTVFLVQNGVLGARKGEKADLVEKLAKAGVTVLADEFSLRERAIAPNRLVAGVKPSPIDALVDHLEHGDKAMWH